MVTPEFKPGGIIVPDTMKKSIVIMFERRNEFLIDELKALGVEL
nr:MAG TPA: hypothetical protein [Bacteriophage sp.]